MKNVDLKTKDSLLSAIAEYVKSLLGEPLHNFRPIF